MASDFQYPCFNNHQTTNMMARLASDISSALTIKMEAAIIANPPRNEIKDFCRQPYIQ